MLLIRLCGKYQGHSVLKNPACFLEAVGNAWEQALVTAENANISVAKMRFGVVLSNQGGALKQMLPAFIMRYRI